MSQVIQVGDVRVTPQTRGGMLRSIGGVQVGPTRLRNTANRFLPWFDTYRGAGIFNRFRLAGVERRGGQSVLLTRAIGDPDYPFMEMRDCSGDPVLRMGAWDQEPVEVDFRIVLEPAAADVGGRHFTGLRYWFEYEGGEVPIHRILDRQTWEIGGDLTDVTILCRGLFDLPRKKVTAEGSFSTVGLDNWAGLLPGNLWGRWSLLPAFDMQYGRSGVLLGWFDRVSCIRTVIESTPGEDWIRHVDCHYFEQTASARTNPKTLLYCDDRLDDVDAMNLWTAVQDQENQKARTQFAMKPEEPPAITFAHNEWRGFQFDKTYEPALDVAAEFGADLVFIDPVWENGEAYERTLRQLVGPEKFAGSILEKSSYENMCCSLDFEVSAVAGGEAGLKRLCDRAAAKGLKVISWMAMHYSSRTSLWQQSGPAAELGHGKMHIFAARESGRHPDTGYPAACWTVNLNAPVFEKIRRQILDLCKRTGLAGYLWDSFSNLGWWQVDYSKGDMRPQFDRMAALYAEMVNAGLYIQPEAVITFSSHSCCGLHGGNIYDGDLLGYSYDTVIGLHYKEPTDAEGKDQANEILTGRRPLDLLFQCFGHKRVPTFAFHLVPRDHWSPQAVAAIKELFASYKKVRGRMVRRTVLKGGSGVRWDNASGPSVLFSFRDQTCDGAYHDAATGASVGGTLKANRVYLTS